MTGTAEDGGHVQYESGHYTAAELVLMTKEDAEGLIATLDAIKAAPADGKADAIAVLGQQMESRGWGTRAVDLSDALLHRPAGLRPGPQFELAWEVHNNIVDVVKTWRQVGAGRGPDSAAIDDSLRGKLTGIIASSTDLTQYDDVKRLLKDDLRPMATGHALDADAAIAKYVTDPTTRKALLTKLGDDRAFVGAVAPDHGLIYKLSDNQGFRVFTYLAPILFFCAAGGVLIAISALHSLFGSGYPTQLWGVVPKPHAAAMFTWHKLLGPYLLVIGGVIVHLIAENLKQDKAGVPILAINDLLAWLNLRWVGLAYSFIPVIIVVVGLSVLNVGAQGHDLTLWLAAGYSVDSVAGLVLNRFDTGSLAYAQLKKNLTPAKPTGT